MGHLRDNLLVQFSVVSFVVTAVIAVVLAIVLSNKIRSDAIDDLVNEAVGASQGRFLSAITPADLEVPMTGERYDRFHQFVKRSIVSERTARIKVWAKDGTVIYANDPKGVGQKFPENQNLQKALQGENAITIKVPTKDPENYQERFLGTLMEVYTPIIFPGASAPGGSLEIYQYYLPTAQRINNMRSWLFGSIAVGFVLLYGGLVSIVWGGRRTITRQRSQLQSFNAELEKQVQERTAELREAQAQLVRSERLAAIGELSAGVAHEIRNPLGAIKNVAYYIRGSVRGSDFDRANPRVNQFLDIMDQEIASSAQIITDLTDFARVNPPSLSLTKLETMVDNSLARMEVKKNVKVVKEFQPDLPEVAVDAEQLRRALANLIKNGDEAMPEGGNLTISGKATDGFVELQVRDTGQGIPESDLPKVFDPLFTTKAKGIGLGLTIVRSVIERHKGTVDVASKLGQGTIFTIRLPLNQEQEVPRPG
jgi:signal transduction histidine kinase